VTQGSIHKIEKKHQVWLDEYLLNCHQLNRSEYTIKNYSSDLRKFLLWFESENTQLISKANADTIASYKLFLSSGGNIYKRSTTHLLKKIFILFVSVFIKKSKKRELLYEQKALAVSSRKRHLSAVKNFFEFHKQINEDKGKLFKLNPVKPLIHGIKLKEKDVKNTPMLEYEDWLKLKESVYRTKERLIIYLLYYAGLRLSELTQLKFSDFKEANKTIRFVRKGGYIHELVPQNADLIFDQLRFYRENINKDNDYLFANQSGSHVSTKSVYNLIKKILLKANCKGDATPHSFRKACATNLYRKTNNLLVVRDYLNHNDAKVTQTYIDKKSLARDYIQYQ